MSKWFGKIGYAYSGETEPGYYEDTVVEKEYYGDITTDRWKRQSSGHVNDNINLANVLSIIADPFAYAHCSQMVYAEIMGERWKVTEIEIQSPRLILTLGGIWNGNTPGTSEQT